MGSARGIWKHSSLWAGQWKLWHRSEQYWVLQTLHRIDVGDLDNRNKMEEPGLLSINKFP
jgi:hypothetical protein